VAAGAGGCGRNGRLVQRAQFAHAGLDQIGERVDRRLGGRAAGHQDQRIAVAQAERHDRAGAAQAARSGIGRGGGHDPHIGVIAARQLGQPCGRAGVKPVRQRQAQRHLRGRHKGLGLALGRHGGGGQHQQRRAARDAAGAARSITAWPAVSVNTIGVTRLLTRGATRRGPP
jgi:hypothetical protein